MATTCVRSHVCPAPTAGFPSPTSESLEGLRLALLSLLVAITGVAARHHHQRVATAIDVMEVWFGSLEALILDAWAGRPLPVRIAVESHRWATRRNRTDLERQAARIGSEGSKYGKVIWLVPTRAPIGRCAKDVRPGFHYQARSCNTAPADEMRLYRSQVGDPCCHPWPRTSTACTTTDLAAIAA